MKTEIKDLWVGALRSGNYGQYKGFLRDKDTEDSFCCLGVLCDLYTKETGEGRWDQGLFIAGQFGGSSPTVLPRAVREWAGILLSDPEAPIAVKTKDSGNLKLKVELSFLNDSDLTFSQIADVIEAFHDGL